MCVNSDIILILRAVLADLDETEFKDNRLEQLIVVAAKFVNADVQGGYVVDIQQRTITPDPIEENDNAFVNMIVLKSACLVDEGNLRMKSALAGIEAVAGPAKIKVGGENFDAYKSVVEAGPCSLYKSMVQDYKLGNGNNYHAILSPFISNAFGGFCDEGQGNRLIS